ncbi:immunity 22 family protein [Acinetobacter sp. AYS6]|uniref:immunity 22 family protein n=1 Tax=Acinetobacter sp. AYS6 TaxID=2983297 RepID=UPI0021D65F4E|nr:immunity 22 family protein [Acinetobacter sp. AYS6]MCU7696817.1 immunity 22 family protein [Acinetobacter sp. AYS6]
MQQDNSISIWVGNLDSSYDLDNYVLNRYSLDGDFEGSLFTDKFQIDFIDEDFVEKSFFEFTNNLELAFNGFSYDEQILEELKLKDIKLLFPINCIILIYNFAYKLNHESVGKVKFLGTLPYKKP